VTDIDIWTDVKEVRSSDTSVKKYVFTNGTAVAESVLYGYPNYETRTVICCSTQSGCPVGCRFCGAGDNFVRNLSSDEIVAQPLHLLDANGILDNEVDRMQVMFMSMGEPLLNLNHLIPALKNLYAVLPRAALLISTSAPRIDYSRVREVSKEIPTIGLQFSIHESTDAARDKLIPFKAKLTLREIAAEGFKWWHATGRKPFFNYCVHPGNNTKDDAVRLWTLFPQEVWEATISVICERDESVAAANARQRQLATDFESLLSSYGYSTRTFDPAGQDDIGGGCGQLWYVQDWMAKNPALARKSIGNGLKKIHTPLLLER
jgi:23S rRNA (adenine2503-C2)-methyltransferase